MVGDKLPSLTDEVRARLEAYDDRGNVVSQRDVMAALAEVDTLRDQLAKMEQQRDAAYRRMRRILDENTT
jgi:polyhydroxyalkanoate synthesis regulator phasin